MNENENSNSTSDKESAKLCRKFLQMRNRNEKLERILTNYLNSFDSYNVEISMLLRKIDELEKEIERLEGDENG